MYIYINKYIYILLPMTKTLYSKNIIKSDIIVIAPTNVEALLITFVT